MDAPSPGSRDGLHKLRGPVHEALLHLQGDVSIRAHRVEVDRRGAGLERPDAVAEVLSTRHVAGTVDHVHAPDLVPLPPLRQLTEANPLEAEELDKVLQHSFSILWLVTSLVLQANLDSLLDGLEGRCELLRLQETTGADPIDDVVGGDDPAAEHVVHGPQAVRSSS